MAERRMFAKTIIDSDAFLDLPLSSQALYFHLSMRADDEGFINNPKKIQRMIGASDDDFKLLLAKNFIIGFESGVIVIKHWKIHNYIQKDRFKATVYEDEKNLLGTKKNGAYTLCIQDVYKMETQVRLGKDSIVKDKQDMILYNNKAKGVDVPAIADVMSYCADNYPLINIDAVDFVNSYTADKGHIKGVFYSDWREAVEAWVEILLNYEVLK